MSPANPPNDGEKFATYTRDAATGLDCANQHYYSNIGRFTTPDSFGSSASAATPQSWNRYAYAGEDPADANDLSELYRVVLPDLAESQNYCKPLASASASTVVK